ncbi:nucleotide cyclase [Haematococcus lacustris]
MQNPYNYGAPIRASAYLKEQYGVASTGLNSWEQAGYNFSDVQNYGSALQATLALPGTAMDFRVADSLKPLSPPRNALLALIGCSNPLVPRSAGSPADFAAAMTSMTSGLRAVRDSLGAAAFREQLWGTTGFVPPTQPPPRAPPSPPLAGGPALSTPLLATVIAVPVGLCLAVMALLLVVITHLRRNAKLQRSLLGHVLPPAAGDKATLVITDVQGSSKLWETLPAGVMEASMKVHDELVRRLALDSSGYEWATEGDSFLLCFHTPQAAVAFATQLQDALLQCSRWASALMAAGSPGQPLCLSLACLRPHPSAHPPSHPQWSSQQVDSPAPPKSLAMSDRQQGGEAAGPPSPTASLASGQAYQEVSLDLLRATPGGVMGGPDCTAPSSLWTSKLGVGMVLPARQSSKSALLWQLHSRSLSQASERSQKKGTVLEPGPVSNGTLQPAAELGQGLLSLLASQPWQQQQTSVMASSSGLQGSDATDASLHQVHARYGLVAWQRLCALYREVEVEEPGALTVLAGLRVRVGMHTGLAADEVLVQSRMGASSTTYGGAALVLAKAVQACAHGGQVTLSAATFVKLPVEELRAAGISVVHMGKHLLELGEGKGDTALDLYCATLDTAAHAHRLWALGPLRTARQLQPGVLQAPYGVTATVFMSVVGLAQLKAWDASLAKECLALYQATAQRVLLHVAGRQLPAGYLVSTADEDGMVLAAFSSSLQCLHWALLTLTTCMDLDWPQALLDSLLGEEMMTEQQGSSYTTATDSSAAAGSSAAGFGQAGCSTVTPSHSVRLLRGLRLKAGVDVGEVACDLTPANGRFNYRGRCLNRAARINGLATSGQVWCSQTAWDHAHASCKPSQLYDTALVEASPAAAQLPTSSASWTEQARQKDSSVTLAKPAVLTVDEVTPCIAQQSGGASLAEQWHQLEHQLHGHSHAGSKAEEEGADRLSTCFLCSQGQPLALPGLLPSLVARPLGSRELRGIPGQVALVQVSLAAHTSRGQAEAADRLGLMAPGLQLG